jgi:hypothetical protein
MEPSGSDFLIQLIPVLTLWLIFIIPGYFIARRKGISKGMFALGIFPLWAGLVVLWWASKTDKDVLDRLERLEKSR